VIRRSHGASDSRCSTRLTVKAAPAKSELAAAEGDGAPATAGSWPVLAVTPADELVNTAPLPVLVAALEPASLADALPSALLLLAVPTG